MFVVFSFLPLFFPMVYSTTGLPVQWERRRQKCIYIYIYRYDIYFIFLTVIHIHVGEKRELYQTTWERVDPSAAFAFELQKETRDREGKNIHDFLFILHFVQNSIEQRGEMGARQFKTRLISI